MNLYKYLLCLFYIIFPISFLIYLPLALLVLIPLNTLMFVLIAREY